MTDQTRPVPKSFVVRFNVQYIFRHQVSKLARRHDVHQAWIPNILDLMTLFFDQKGEIYIGNETKNTHYRNLISIECGALTNHVIVTLGHTDGSEFDIYIEAESLDHVRKLRSPNYN